MPFEPLFCDRCHESIPDADIENGKAVRIGSDVLHVGCAFRRAMPGPGRRLPLLLALLAGAAAAYAVVSVRDLKAARDDDRAGAAAYARADHLEKVVEGLRGDLRAAVAAQGEATANEVRRVADDLRSAGGRSQEALAGLLRSEAARQADATASRFEAVEQQLATLREWVSDVRRRAAEVARAPADPGPAVTPPAPPAPPPPTEPAAGDPPPAGPTPARPPVDPAVQRERDAELARLLKMLKDSDPARSFSATFKLKELKDLRAVPDLVDVLRTHKDYYTRLGAASALGELKSCDAVPALIEAIDDKDELVRVAAGEAIATIRGEPTRQLVGLSAKDRRAVRDDLAKWWREHEAAVRTRLGQAPAGKTP